MIRDHHRCTLTFTAEAREQLEALLSAEPCDEDWYQLRRKAEELALMPGFDRLIALDQNRIQELPHQIDVAQRVLQPPMRGRAVLADEVGLGKTIEAGLIFKELAVRGLARRVLIVAPASLVGQWQAELETKFLEKFATPTSAARTGMALVFKRLIAPVDQIGVHLEVSNGLALGRVVARTRLKRDPEQPESLRQVIQGDIEDSHRGRMASGTSGRTVISRIAVRIECQTQGLLDQW